MCCESGRLDCGFRVKVLTQLKLPMISARVVRRGASEEEHDQPVVEHRKADGSLVVRWGQISTFDICR